MNIKLTPEQYTAFERSMQWPEDLPAWDKLHTPIKISSQDLFGDKRFEDKLAHADAMSAKLQPKATGVSTVPVPKKTDAQTWDALKEINDSMRGSK